ncbi:MAG: S1 RNA-binding domain-containing protein, partial [Planctomycetota bacterium]|nr:S1 RNA-binding domain-containing protein [Planctomycetota bacterium]
MSSPRQPSVEVRLARYLGLKVPVMNALREGLAAGEFPVFLRCASPALAGQFPHAFGFELLLERLRQAESLERRRGNLLRAFEGREEEFPEAVEIIQNSMDEGELEDAGLVIHPSHAPVDFEAPEKEEYAGFLVNLRGDAKLALQLQRKFRLEGTMDVTPLDPESEEKKRFHNLAQGIMPIAQCAPDRYLQLRRAERAHAVNVEFGIPAAVITQLFESLESYPKQEKESYRGLFTDFIKRERLPRLVQQVRGTLKRRAEEASLQNGWEQVERSLDRGQNDNLVIGVCAAKKGRMVLAAAHGIEETPRTIEVDLKSESLAEDLKKFIGEEQVALVAVQADTATRSGARTLMKSFPSGKPRMVMVPMAVVKTMLREVARRPADALLSHDERQAFLVATMAADPRAAAFHTPHIVRAFIPFRGEINHRILDDFETTFLSSLLASKGVDVNTASADSLRLVPGLDADGVVVERSTAPFRSLRDLQDRIGLTPEAWRAACCMLRVRSGDEPLDGRSLHPMYYGILKQTMASAEVKVQDLVKDPGKIKQMDWSAALEGEREAEGILQRVKEGLSKSGRSRLRIQPGAGPQKGGGSKRGGGRKLEALVVGELMKGKVKNLAEYGAFIEFGCEREGLVHVSHCSETFIKHPSEALKEGQDVEVRVLGVDLAARKIRLSLLTEEQEKEREAQRKQRQGGRGDGDGDGGGGRGGQGGGGRGGQGGGGRGGQGGG